MCGRARCTLRADDVPRACYRHGLPARFLHIDRYRPSYNVAPGSDLPVVRRDNEGDGDGVVVHSMKWGLVPSFTKKTDKPDFFKMFNARCESVSEKASFRRLLPKNRCLVAVEGFYEWKKDGSKKQPYYIHFKDGRPLVFAALYDSWRNSEGETLYSFTILTTSCSSALQWLHDRMPVILGDKESADTWLDDPSTAKFKTVLKSYENPDLVWYPVTPAMGKTSFDGPECIQEIPLKPPETSLISKFFSAKQPRKEERKRETESTIGNVPVDMKLEPTAEDHKRAVLSDNTEKNKELDEEKKTISDETTKMDLQRIVKEEQLMEGYTVSYKDEPDEEQTSIQDESIKTYLNKILKEEEHLTQGNKGVASSLESSKEESGKGEVCALNGSIRTDIPDISKDEPESQREPISENEGPNQSTCTLEIGKEKPQNEDCMLVTSPSGREDSDMKSGDLESSEQSSGKGGRTKRDYEAFSADQKPSKHAENTGRKRGEKSYGLKSSEKVGKKKEQKKRDLNSSGDKQSTLHSYFGKK